jgi:hypothetical protein
MALQPNWQQRYELPPEALQKVADYDAGGLLLLLLLMLMYRLLVLQACRVRCAVLRLCWPVVCTLLTAQ